MAVKTISLNASNYTLSATGPCFISMKINSINGRVKYTITSTQPNGNITNFSKYSIANNALILNLEQGEKLYCMADASATGDPISITLTTSPTLANIYYVDPVYTDSNSGYTAEERRAAIQSAIDSAEADGGGIVQLASGIAKIRNDGEGASGGGLRFKTANPRVWLRGVPNATIIMADDNLTKDMTGIIRTQSGLAQSGIYISDLIIDGNKDNNTFGTIAFFSGVSPNTPVNIAVAGTVGTVTWTNHGFLAGRTVCFDSLTQDMLFGDYVIQSITDANTFVITVLSGCVTETGVRGYDGALANKCDTDITLERVTARNCNGAYGFDAHELTRRIKYIKCSASGNDGPGNALDGCWDFEIDGGDYYGNGVTGSGGGIEFYTGSRRGIVKGVRSYNNGTYGIDFEGAVKDIHVVDSYIAGNTQNGIYAYGACRDCVIGRNIIEMNGTHGIQLRDVSGFLVNDNIIMDNSQTTTNTSDGIYLDGGAGANTNVNNIISGNLIRNLRSPNKLMRYGINNQSASVSNVIVNNILPEGGNDKWGTGAFENAGLKSKTTPGIHPGYVANRWYGPALLGAFTTVTPVANQVYFIPFWIPNAARLNQVAIEVQTVGSATTTWRVGVYASNKNQPGDLIADLGSYTISTASVGGKTYNHSDLRLAGGWYFIALVGNGAVTMPVITAKAADAAGLGGFMFGFSGNNPVTGTPATSGLGWFYTDAGATYVGSGLPTVAPSATELSGACPNILFQSGN